MSATYDALGVRFLYPENWQITDEQTSGSPLSVALQSPDGAIWVLQIFDEGLPRELAAQALKTMRQEYPELEASPITEQIEGHEVVGFDMQFYCLDFVVTAQARSVQKGDQTLVLFTQAENRDFDRLAPVFAAMLVSILKKRSKP